MTLMHNKRLDIHESLKNAQQRRAEGNVKSGGTAAPSSDQNGDADGGCTPTPCSPWNRGDTPPTLPLTVIGVVGNKPVLVWYHDRTKCWHDNPAAFGSIPVEWWQYLPDCELLKANSQAQEGKSLS